MSAFKLLFVINIAGFIDATPSDFDCPMKQLLLEYSVEINPTLNERQLQDVVDALNGSPLAKLYGCNIKPHFPINHTKWHCP